MLLFAWLAVLASETAIPAYDVAWRAAVHSYQHPWLTVVMKSASLVGSGWGLWPLGAVVWGSLWRAGRARDAALFGLAVVGANLISECMKFVFHRPRPDPWFGYAKPSNFSFPSGHAFVAVCFFLCLAEILIRDDWPPAARLATWFAAAGCALLIGLSRVYLGVHYPTDVIGGYAAAIVWTTLIRIAHHHYQERKKIPVRTVETA